MQILRIKKKTDSKIGLAAFMITTYCLYTDIKIGKTDIEVLSYMMVYGFKKSTKELILRSKILNSKNSLENVLTRLRQLGLIIRDVNGDNMLTSKLPGSIGSNLGIIIQLENI